MKFMKPWLLVLVLIAVLVMGADLKESASSILGSATVDMQAGDSKTTVYTVPVGKTAIITHVVIRSPSASLNATGTGSFDIGSGASATSWRQNVDFDTMTATTDYMVVIGGTDTKYTMEVAGATFGIKPDVTNGAVNDVTATMEVHGYLF